jgi:hypothetical protein
LPPRAIGLQVLGIGPMYLPLPPVLPGALPGCVGLVTPDDVQFGSMTPGAMIFALPVPNNLSLVGATLFGQALQIEPSGIGYAISTSNATQLTVGVL